jgi:hypothetical protein
MLRDRYTTEAVHVSLAVERQLRQARAIADTVAQPWPRCDDEAEACFTGAAALAKGTGGR